MSKNVRTYSKECCLFCSDFDLEGHQCFKTGDSINFELTLLCGDSHGCEDIKPLELDKRIEILWDEFANSCIDEDDNIDADFFIWDKGTFREDIWHWFDKLHSKGIHYLIYNYCNN